MHFSKWVSLLFWSRNGYEIAVGLLNGHLPVGVLSGGRIPGTFCSPFYFEGRENTA